MTHVAHGDTRTLLPRWLGIASAVVSIIVVSLVLLWGTDGRAGAPAFELAVHILGVAAPLGSVLLTWLLWRDGRRGAALLSGSPLLFMGAVAASASLGVRPSLTLLLWLDLYILLVFIAILGRHGRRIAGN